MSLTIIPGTREAQARAQGVAASAGRVQNAIASAASSTGVDFKYLYHQAKIESGLNPNAKASTSSASGLYQFIEQSWLGVVQKHGAEHGLGWAANAIQRTSTGRYAVADETTRQQILALRQDPETSAAMAGEYASDNKALLEAKLGREAGSVDLYMAHFLGPAGATRFLAARDADPNQSAASINPAAARANRWVFYDRDGSPRSLQQVYDKFAARFAQSEGSPSTGGATIRPAILRDTPGELSRMQLAALNGVDGSAQAADDMLATGRVTQAALLTPSPQTARLAYLMLASLGVS